MLNVKKALHVMSDSMVSSYTVTQYFLDILVTGIKQAEKNRRWTRAAYIETTRNTDKITLKVTCL